MPTLDDVFLQVTGERFEMDDKPTVKPTNGRQKKTA